MRYFFCLITLLLLTSHSGFAQKKLLYGTWNIISVDGKTPNGSDADIVLAFSKDGTFEMGDNRRTEQGTWELSADNKTLHIKLKSDSETITIIELSKKSMKLDNRGSVAVFERTGKAPKVKKVKKVKLKGVSAKLAATWQITTINGVSMIGDEFPVTIIQLNEDGSAWSSIIGAGGEIGTWKVMEDGKQIVINFNEEEKPADFSLLDNDKTLELKDVGAVIRLTRIDAKIEKPQPYEEPWEEPVEPSNPVEEPIGNKVEVKDLIGEWTVVTIDNDPLESRNLVLKINTDGTFTIMDNGELERKGTWELKKNNQLSIKDDKGYSSDYTAIPGTTGVLLLKDYYGEMKLEKR